MEKTEKNALLQSLTIALREREQALAEASDLREERDDARTERDRAHAREDEAWKKRDEVRARCETLGSQLDEAYRQLNAAAARPAAPNDLLAFIAADIIHTAPEGVRTPLDAVAQALCSMAKRSPQRPCPNKIDLIRWLRAMTGSGLKEAKDAIEKASEAA